MQNKILDTLSYCKEIRDTAYPMKDSLVTELNLVEFTARKEKDLIYINGSLMLEDGCRHEVRTFEAYIIEDKEIFNQIKNFFKTNDTEISVIDKEELTDYGSILYFE